MKKSLSLLLSLALVFGLFQSMAAAADSDLTTAQKYDELVNKGVLKGTTSGDRELERTLTRAEFATIAIAIAGLAEEKPAEATFSDVTSNQWWYGAIEAAAKAELVNGTGAGKFEPRNNVTIEQVIQVAAKIVELEPVEDAEIEGASSWAQGYIQAALDKGLIAEGLNYTADATRGQTIEVAYSAYQVLNPPVADKVTVEAKAAGLKKVEVSLAKAVDTEKAVLTLKKGNTTVATDTEFSEDKKSATLTLKDNGKISAGTYTVTLTGLADEDVAKATSEFTAEDETVKKLEFVTSSDEIAASKKAKVKISAENQYGEQASFSASNYSVNTMNLTNSLRKDSEGYLILTLDTDTTNNTHLIPNVSQIPVYITFDPTRLMVNKVFKLGNLPYATKLDLGEVKYSNDKDQLSSPGEVATVEMKVFDQYGNPITPEQEVNINANAFILPYNDALEHAFNTDDDTYKVKVSINGEKKVEKADSYTLTVHAGSDSKTATIKVGHSKVAMKLKIGEAGTIAEGDKNKYVTLEVLDADGNALSNQEIADNKSRINVTVSGATSDGIVTVGKHKGKIKLDEITARHNGSVFVTASIATIYTQSHDSKPFKVEAPRVPAKVVAETKPHAKAVLNGESEVKFVIKDQYEETLNTKADNVSWAKAYGVQITLTGSNGIVTTAASTGASLGTLTTAGSGSVAFLSGTDFTEFNKKFNIDTRDIDRGVARFEVELFADPVYDNSNAPTKIVGGSSLSKIVETIESIAPTSNLVYSIGDLGTLYAVDDAPQYYDLDDELDNYLTSNLSKKVALTVKDPAGNSVAVPNDLIRTLTSSNQNVLKVNPQPTEQDLAKAIGVKAGTASVTAVVYAVDGSTKYLTANATVKNDPIVVQSISSDGEVNVANNQQLGTVLANAEVTVKDQYGNVYEKEEVLEYAAVLNLSFSVSDLVRTGSGTVDISRPITTASAFTIADDVLGFTLNIVSPDGKVVESIQVTRV